MINAQQFRQYVVREPLKAVGLWSPEAEELLMGTAAQESHLGTFLRQVGGGPALGVFQMEPATHDDIRENYLSYRSGSLLARIGPRISTDPEDMVTDLAHAAIMARVHYLRVPEPLPAVDDLGGQACYWKQHYNTARGRGTIAEYKANYTKFVLRYRK